jgi:hypothetical protein
MGLSARQAAKTLGLTHQALVKAAKTGRVTKEEDGTYDVEKARRQLAENSNALKRRKPKKYNTEAATEGGNHLETVATMVATPATEEESGNRTLAEAQRRREWLRVQKDQLDLARKRGELVSVGALLRPSTEPY